MSFFNFLKVPPHVEEISDQEVVKRAYRYWRLRIFYGMYVGYAFYYLTRKSFTYAMPVMIQELGFTKAEVGGIGSVLALSYGISKFFSGVIADRSNPRYFMAIGLIVTGFLNILFASSSSILLFLILWGLNGWFQGWGWPPCARLLSHWYARSERSKWWGIWNTSHNVGGGLIYLIVAYLAEMQTGWRIMMMTPGIMAIIGGVFLINRLRDTPQSIGLPPIEKYRNEEIEGKQTSNIETLSFMEVLKTYILKNRLIWILAFAYFFVYIVRAAVNEWLQLFLLEQKGYSYLSAGSCVFWFEMGGLGGGLLAGWLSDFFFQSRRGPINILCVLATLGTLFVLWASPPGALWTVSLTMVLCGFLVFGPQMLIGMSAVEFSDKNAAGTATGFTGCFAYLGAAFAGYPLGLIVEKWGWDGFFITLALSSLLAASVLLPTWNAKVVKSKRD